MKKMKLWAVGALLSVLFASCAFHSSKHSFGPYSAAETFYSKGNYPKAIEKYQEYLAENPKGNLAATAEYYVAKSYAASGNPDRARESFERVLKTFPGTSWAAFSKEQLEALDGVTKV
ncbi:MAG: tetratricopeptide repeat protein [Candidatus Omnitrophota bacterium]